MKSRWVKDTFSKISMYEAFNFDGHVRSSNSADVGQALQLLSLFR